MYWAKEIKNKGCFAAAQYDDYLILGHKYIPYGVCQAFKNHIKKELLNFLFELNIINISKAFVMT